ncbi:hypothetical protein ACHAPY_011616 [Fusarium culmorum]
MWATLEWLLKQAEAPHVDPKRIAVMGERAGRCLATSLASKARDANMSPGIARQILLAPMIDDRNTDHAEGPFKVWDKDDNLTRWTAYLGKATGRDDVSALAAPGRLKDATGMPPLYVVMGQMDLFAKESLDYVRKYVDAGVETECHLYPGLRHGFEVFAPGHRASNEMDENRKRILRSL